MRINTTVTKRIFSIDEISETEGKILRTLLNINTGDIRNRLNDDKDYWINDINGALAVDMGIGIRDKIMNMVDK